MPLNVIEFDFIRTLIQDHSAIVFEPHKKYLLEMRLEPLLQEEGFNSVQELVQQLRQTSFDTPLRRKMLEAMTTNETSFFRNIKTFDVLRNNILPELIEKRSREKRLNIWCGASSTGQEPYSIAILIREYFPSLKNWFIKIIATDLSNQVLKYSKEAVYSQLEVNRGLPVQLLVKYFKKHDDKWHLNEDIRRMVDFKELNLIKNWPPLPLMDIIFLRNVLIYFNIESKRNILNRVCKLLKPDGYLFLGSGETTMHLNDAFQWIPFEKAECYKLKT